MDALQPIFAQLTGPRVANVRTAIGRTDTGARCTSGQRSACAHCIRVAPVTSIIKGKVANCYGGCKSSQNTNSLSVICVVGDVIGRRSLCKY